MLVIFNKNHIFNEYGRITNLIKAQEYARADSGAKVARLVRKLAKDNGKTVPEFCTIVGIELPMPDSPTLLQQQAIINKLASYV